MDSPSSPTVRRRRLAAELKRLRGSRTGTEVARGVAWSTSKVSRAESGRDSLPPAEIEKLIDFYGATGPLRARLLDLAEDATKRGWWEDYADALTPEYMEFIGLEAEATASLQWQIDAVPGLIQTEAYARELNAAYRTVVPTTPPGVFERSVQVRMQRQKLLTRDPALQLFIVMDEAVLLRRVGDRDVMRAQLARLAEVAELPSVDLRISPLDRKLALGAASFVILRFGSPGEPGALGDVVSTETLDTELYIEGENDTHLYRLFFQALADASLTPESSRDLIVTTINRVWS